MPSNAPLFSVHDHNELLALWRLVYDAKFQTELRDRDFWGSPFVNNIAKRLDEAMIDSYSSEGKPENVQRHLQWRRSLPENIFVLKAVRDRLKEIVATAWWRSQSHESKVAYLRGCLCPFEPEDEFVEGLIREAEV